MKRFIIICIALGLTAPAAGEDLYHKQAWANVAADTRARDVGDVLTVVVIQNAEARNAARNDARREHSIDGAIQGGSTDERGHLSLNGAYSGQGEVRRSESFVTQISVSVDALLANGDYHVSGDQIMFINGERTRIRVRGRVRPSDINRDNEVLSTHIADAEIDYDGRGFVSRNAHPGFLHSLFSLLGLGG